VEVVARSIAAASVERLAVDEPRAAHATYHVVNPYTHDGISLDLIVDWVNAAGYPVKRVPEYEAWYRTFEDRLSALAEPMRRHSPLAILDSWERPEAFAPEIDDSRLLAHLRAISPGLAELPHVSEPLIHRMLDDMVELPVIAGPG
jgi:fatty acid CoA ligase FadD9